MHHDKMFEEMIKVCLATFGCFFLCSHYKDAGCLVVTSTRTLCCHLIVTCALHLQRQNDGVRSKRQVMTVNFPVINLCKVFYLNILLVPL